MNRQEQQTVLLLAVTLLGVYVYLSYGRTTQSASPVKASSTQGLKNVQTVFPTTNAERLLLGIPMPLNRASEQDLELIPGIGPKLAQRITSFREQKGPFKNIADLKAVKGIGEKKLKQITPYVSLKN